MIGKFQLLIGGVLLASAMMLGGCVAPAGDDDDAEEASASLVVEEQVGQALLDRGIDEEAQVQSVIDTIDDASNDPQPNPWVPTASTQGPPGPVDPGPSPLTPNKNR